MVTNLEDKLPVPNPGAMDFDVNVQSSSWVVQNLLHRGQIPTWAPLLLPIADIL